MDRYGHVNNMIYYGYMDTVVTEYLSLIHISEPTRPY